MKKAHWILGLALVAGMTVSCGDDKNEEKTEEKAPKASEETPAETEEEAEVCTYTFKPEATVVRFTGFKHANKTAVPGTFEIKQFDGPTSASSQHELVMGLTGTVETSQKSVFTNDTTRDRKLSQFFFGKMVNGANISAKVLNMNAEYDVDNNSGGKCSVEITMNDVTFETSAIYTIEDTEVSIKATLDFNNWNLDEAHASIAEACEAKHTSEADGEAITHKEAVLEITTSLEKSCE